MLKLKPDPTFEAPVSIGVPGGEPVKLRFTFKHRTRDSLQKFLTEEAPEMEDRAIVMAVAVGWELADKFSDENVRALCQNYIAAPRAILDTYIAELTQARAKN